MNIAYVFFADGFEEIEAFTTIDVLRRAGITVNVVTVSEDEIVTGAHDIPLITDFDFGDSNYSDAGVLVLPGGMPGAETLSEHDGLKALVTDFVNNDRLVAAICAAPMVLGKLGLLKGKKVTCYPGFEKYLEGAECTGNMVEKDGNLITGKGPGAAMAFALAIVEALLGKEKVNQLIKEMCVEL